MTAYKTVADIVGRRKQLLTINSASSVAEAAKQMSDGQVGSLVVLAENGTSVGIITERDVLNKIVARGGDARAARVAEVMTPNVITVSWSVSFEEVQRLMTTHRIRHLLIAHCGRAVGIISIKDVLQTNLAACETIIREQARALRELESKHPGITQVKTDRAGRVLI